MRAYRITASVLVKLGEPDLAWPAADRAVTVAAGHPRWTAVAAVPLAQALRAAGRGRLATTVTIAAANRIGATAACDGSPVEPALSGTLWVEAALAAASCGDARSAAEWLDLAAGIAERSDDRHDPHLSGFGPVTVQVAHVAAAVEIGDGGAAVTRHETVVRADGWRRLPVEHRAAHLVDAARAYLQIGDLLRAGRALTEADRIAPAEVRMRPAARTVIAEVARAGRRGAPGDGDRPHPLTRTGPPALAGLGHRVTLHLLHEGETRGQLGERGAGPPRGGDLGDREQVGGVAPGLHLTVDPQVDHEVAGLGAEADADHAPVGGQLGAGEPAAALLGSAHPADVELVGGRGLRQRGSQTAGLDQVRVEAHTQCRRDVAHD
ncbi:hypothetical protein [Micromonospora sp. AB353]|uniref:hypothetical protein n=1 Tax=Micromonospora sp. AB353 TaxID=3413282 RepID=UPI003C1AB15B